MGTYNPFMLAIGAIAASYAQGNGPDAKYAGIIQQVSAMNAENPIRFQYFGANNYDDGCWKHKEAC